MKSIDEFLKIIKDDPDLKTIIKKSGCLEKRFAVRKNSRNSQNGLVLKSFWEGIEGAEFRHLFETRYAVNRMNYAEISKLKTALMLYIREVRDT